MNGVLRENEQISNENLLYIILMIIGVTGFALKYATKIVEFFVWLILTNTVLYVMMIIGLIGFIMFIIRSNKIKN